MEHIPLKEKVAGILGLTAEKTIDSSQTEGLLKGYMLGGETPPPEELKQGAEIINKWLTQKGKPELHLTVAEIREIIGKADELW